MHKDLRKFHDATVNSKPLLLSFSMGIPELSWIHSYVEWTHSKLVWFHSNLEWIHTSMWQFFGELRALNIFKNSKCIYVTWPSKNFLYNVNQYTIHIAVAIWSTKGCICEIYVKWGYICWNRQYLPWEIHDVPKIFRKTEKILEHLILLSFQSQKRLYIHKCPFVFVC